MTEAAKGVMAILAACTVWGGALLYYKHFAHIPAAEMLAHRSLWTAVTFVLLLAFQRRLGEVRALVTGPEFRLVILSGLTIALNWGIFIWAVQSGHALEASLGYYIFPLLAVVLGFAVLGERLRGAQVFAIAVALAAVGVLSYGLRVPPFVALSLAGSFALYGMLKKRLRASAVVSVTVEVLLVAPVMLVGLVVAELGLAGPGSGWLFHDAQHLILLPLAGLITGGPLILYSWGAQRVSLSTAGVAQYLNPTLQFASAALILGEGVTRWHLIALAMIWGALVVYTLSALRAEKFNRNAETSVGTSATTVI